MNPTDEGVTTPGSMPPPREPGLPTRIGHYSIRRRIASGGMGTVYEAIQDEPRRPVALKVVKANMGSPEVLRRFQFEAQILARLRHPGIAQVYEAGTHDDGHGPVPYFAMEYIPSAKSITEYAAAQNLDVRERLELFARVCDAVHHGHQKGVIHRDLKPGNILVDSAGNPHVIDFGVARATDPDQAMATVQTEVGQLVGSIAYMSPEQFEADPGDLDTRSDVYALGVVLYELLGGELPYDVMRTKVFDAARVIREASPKKLGTVKPALRGEVETIVHKALEKDRDRRYQSAYGLAEDIRRYLSGQAIAAKTSSIGYHVQVFARRNKLLLGAVAAVFVVLVGALVASTSLYLRAEQERDRAARENTRSRAAIQFLTTSLESVTPEAFDEEPTLDDLMQGMARSIDGAFPEDPLVEAEIRTAIARGTFSMAFTPDRWQTIETQLKRAVDLWEGALGADAPETMASRRLLAVSYSIRGMNQELVDVRRRMYEVRVAADGEEAPGTLSAEASLAEALARLPRYEESENLTTQVLEAQRRVLGPDHEDTLDSWGQLIWLKIMRGRVEEAGADATEFLATCERLFGPDHKLSKVARSELAATKILEGRVQEAQVLYGNRQVPADLDPSVIYQGTPSAPGKGVKLFVYWETWCPFSQRTVPSLEPVHLRNPQIEIVGLTGANPPSTDEKVSEFLNDNQVTYPVLKIGPSVRTALDVPGTPWLVLARNGMILWESDMEAPATLITQLLGGMAREGMG